MIRKVNVKKTDDPRYHLNPWLVRWRTDEGRRPKRNFPTRRAAEKYADMLRGQFAAGLYNEFERIPWPEMVERYIVHMRGNQLAESTIKIYREVLDEFAVICPCRDSSQINIKSVMQYKKTLSEADNTPTNINKKLRHLSAFCNWAVKCKYLPKNPVPQAGKLKEPKKLRTVITPEQFAKIMAVPMDPQWRALIHLGINGVARKNSLAALRVQDIDFEAGTVKAYDKKQATERLTPIHPASLAALKEYVAELPKGQEKLFTIKFHHETWNRILEKAKVPFITFHGLRTCMSTWLKEAGVSGDVVTAIFGHSTPTITYQHYTNLDNVAAKRNAINKLPL